MDAGPGRHCSLLLPEGVREQLRTSQQGWHMVEDPYQFNRNSWTPSKTAMRFEAGSPNTLGQTGLHASIGLLQDIGMQQVEANVVANSFALSDRIVDIPGLELSRPFDPQRVSGIVSFKSVNQDPAQLQQVLRSRGLSCTVRANAIRLSPHFYQAGEPVLEMLNVIEDATRII